MAAILLGLVILAGTVFLADPGRTSGSNAITAAGTFEATAIGIAEVKVRPGTPGPDETPLAQDEVLTRVTIPPGGSVPDNTAHQGPSVLYVQTGAICYNLSSPAGEIIVQAPSVATVADSATPAAASDCPTPAPECAVSCPFNSPGSVLLVEGDSVIQSVEPLQSVIRGYENVGSGDAVVLIADLQTDDPGLGCGGACP